MNKATSLSLLSNAVVLWNTVHIMKAVEQVRSTGTEVNNELLLVHIHPLMHAHVIPNGTYFAGDENEGDDIAYNMLQ